MGGGKGGIKKNKREEKDFKEKRRKAREKKQPPSTAEIEASGAYLRPGALFVKKAGVT